MHLQVYEVQFADRNGRTFTRVLPADDRREAMRVARHTAQANGWSVASDAPAVHVADPSAGTILYEGDFLKLPTFARTTCTLYAKSPRHAEDLAQRLASEQSLIFCPASVRLVRDNAQGTPALHVLNAPSRAHGERMLPATLEPLNASPAAIARQHELAALALIARMGWATCEQVAFGLSVSEYAARRTLQRLRKRGDTLRTMPAQRLFAHSLTQQGVLRLESEANIASAHAVDARTIARTCEHRLVANNAILVAMKNAAVSRVYFEHEVATRKVGFPAEDKRPDGLFVAGMQAAWLEVEASTRSSQAWASLLSFLASAFRPQCETKLTTGETVGKVVFVCRDPAAFRSALSRRLKLLEAAPSQRTPELARQLHVSDDVRAFPVRVVPPAECLRILAACDFVPFGTYTHLPQ